MSISTLTTLAAVRDERAPKRRDLGKSESQTDDQRATLLDLLVTLIPTEVVAPYTAAVALIVGAVDKPTPKMPHPDQLTTYRWIAFALLLGATIGLVLVGKWRKGSGRVPLLETIGAAIAATGWAFALPESPLIPHFDSTADRIAAPAVAAFGAVAINLVIAAQLKKQRS